MLFNSVPFLVFFPCFVLLYFALRGRGRLWLCLLASYLFYGWWDWRFLALLGTSTALDFAIGIKIGNASDLRARRALMVFSVIANLGILATFKYFNFFASSFVRVTALLGWPIEFAFLHIILPVGVSFYTFQSLSYVLDVYWKHIEPERDAVRYAAFVAFWPQLVAGPIVRAIDLLPQLRRDQTFDGSRLIGGLNLMLWGFFKKIVVADSLAAVVDSRFADPWAHGTASLFIGLFFYAFQIYCDFSGYSDIAIGAARTLGIEFGVNFKKPYFSRSFSEFWTRWHVSLSSWLRDYLYIPLGGNRKGVVGTYRNLMIVMLLGGLWHGANWTFIAWGALHGFYLIIQRLVARPYSRIVAVIRLSEPAQAMLEVSVVFALTCFAWIFFRSDSIDLAFAYVQRTFGFQALYVTSVPMLFSVVKGGALIGGLVCVEALGMWQATQRAIVRWPVIRLAGAAAMLWGIALLGTFSGARFIYFQF